MYDIRQFKPALYVLVMMGITGFALAAQQPGLWVLGIGATLINGWLVKTGRFVPLPRLLANIITLLAFVFVAVQVRQIGPRAVLVIGQFLVLLQLIKLFEQRANRDYAQLLVLSLLLMVAASINTASLVFGILLIAYLFLSLYCCLLFHLKVETDQAREAISISQEKLNPATLRQDQRYLPRSMRRLTGLVSLVAIMMAVVVFLFFPRGTGAGMLAPLQFRSNDTLTGFSEQVGFEQVARITQNAETVALVKVWKNDRLVEGTTPLLLRGLTLDVYNGDGSEGGGAWQWTRSRGATRELFTAGAGTAYRFDDTSSADEWRQDIWLKPTGTTVLFGMAGITSIRPQREIEGIFSPSDQVLRSMNRIEQPIEYEVTSRGTLWSNPNPPPVPDSPQSGSERSEWESERRRRPTTSVIHPRILEYARRPEVGGTDANGPLAQQRGAGKTPSPLDATIAANIERHLQSEFAYTLDLTDATNLFDEDPIVAFLYELKRGHCEYFAGAMTLLCQSLGMKARMVIGFKCDEYNNFSSQYVVQQLHAHAWVEVQTPDGAWLTFDPTSGQDPRESMRQARLWKKLKHFFDYLEYSWASNVVAYDRDTRQNIIESFENQMTNTAIDSHVFFKNFSGYLDNLGLWLASRVLGPIMALMVLAMIGAIFWFAYEKWRLRRRAERIGLDALPTRQQLRLARQLGFYDDLLRLLERRNIYRPRHLTPLEFSNSLTYLPSEAYDTVQRLTRIFYRIRYGSEELSPRRQHRLAGVISRIEHRLPPS